MSHSKELEISEIVMSGFMIYPYFPFQDFDFVKNRIEWYVSQKINENRNNSFLQKVKTLLKRVKVETDSEDITWNKCCEGLIFAPDISHINCFVKCTVTQLDEAGQPGSVSSVTSGQVISAGPQCHAIDKR